MSDIAIIGGGAAGLMAASLLSQAGIPCDLYEKKDRFGLKIGITGKGRCNITNACDAERFRANIMKGDRFLYSAFSRYDNLWLMEYFQERGLPLKVERGERVFPVSDRALDVVGTLLKSCDERYVTRIKEEVTDVISDDGFILITKSGKHRYETVCLIRRRAVAVTGTDLLKNWVIRFSRQPRPWWACVVQGMNVPA